jgi:alkylation response protein AidB-like acyl-CoA dehydrogenase
MSVLLTAEQREFRQALRDFLSEKAGADYRRRRLESALERDEALWQQFEQLGLRDFFSSQDGETKPGALELGILARECGRALIPEALTDFIFAGPYFFFHVLPASAVSLAQHHFGSTIGTDIAQGKKRVALARSTFFRPANLEQRGSEPLVRVSGKLEFVAGAPKADFLLLAATTGGKDRVLLADLRTGKEQKVSCSRASALDLTLPHYDVELANVAALQLPELLLLSIRHRLSALVAEELAGVAAVPLEMTLDHVQTRKQFGTALGSFQAVQHRLADMLLKVEAMGSLATFASWCIDRSPDQAALACLSALAFGSEQCALVTEAALQMHGGIGFTWEYDLHLYLRRAKSLEILFGSTPERIEELLAAV